MSDPDQMASCNTPELELSMVFVELSNSTSERSDDVMSDFY